MGVGICVCVGLHVHCKYICTFGCEVILNVEGGGLCYTCVQLVCLNALSHVREGCLWYVGWGYVGFAYVEYFA